MNTHLTSSLQRSLLPLLFALCATVSVCAADPPRRELIDGRLHVDGRWVFLKIAKPLRNFADPREVQQLIDDLPVLQAKHYNAIEINCYWHHFDRDGDGAPDVSCEPLVQLIDAVAARGMFPCLSVETYGVGGGTVPAGFWKEHPDAVAVNSDGKPVRDTEYGFGSIVPSQFCPAYVEAAHHYIRTLTRAVPHEKLLYFETTVEPQYIGNQWIDFSEHARRAYEAWRAKQSEAAPDWPAAFPVPDAFLNDPRWLRFRAEALAAWVSADAVAFRDVAGKDAWVAVDYLETDGPEMPRRNGDSLTFLRNLRGVDIIQVNWHWHNARRAPNLAAYEHVRSVMRETGEHWAITEHMTLNGSDYAPDVVDDMLRNTLRQGTRFGWEFVNIAAASDDPFSLYHDDWSPKPLMAPVDNAWDQWMREVRDSGE